MQQLTEVELQYLEKILGDKLSEEIDRNRTWQTKNHYERPMTKSRVILNCLNAVKSQKQYIKIHSVKW